MPFITEDIYHQLKERKQSDDLTVKLKTGIGIPNPEILKQCVLLKEAITAIREARNKNNLKLKETIKLFIETKEEKLYKQFESILSKQVNAESIAYTQKAEPGAYTVVNGETKFHLFTNKEIDTAEQKEQLLKDLEYQKGFLASVEKKLSNERFVQNAKPEVIESERKKKADAEVKIKTLQDSISLL